MLRLFPESDLELVDGHWEGDAPSLDTLHEQIRRQRILDSARSVLRSGADDSSIRIRLHKQVAHVGKVSFAEEDALLGFIELIISDVDPLPFIDLLAPETVDGEEVSL